MSVPERESAIVTVGLKARHLNTKEKPDIKCTLSSILEKTDAQNYVMENEDRMKTEPPRLETG